MPVLLERYQEFVSRAPRRYERLFGMTGRINRAWYWLYLAFAIPALGALHGAFHADVMANLGAYRSADGPSFSGELLDLFGALCAMLVMILILIAGAAMTVKRLHDRDKTGSWIAHFVAAPCLLFWLGQHFLDEHLEAVHSLPFLLQFVALFVFVWSFVELCCRRGTAGDNRFGPDPLRPQTVSPTGMPQSLAR